MGRGLRSVVLAAALSLAACGEAPSAAEAPASEASIAFLVEAAAADLRLYVAPSGVSFRNVHAGVLRGDDGLTRSLLCGELRASDQEPWVAFATIETEPYENWIGAVAAAHCAAPGVTLETGRDLSEEVGRRYGVTE